MAAIAALRELWTERQTAEARLGGGLTVMVRRKQPIEITGEADGVALVEKAGRGAVAVAVPWLVIVALAVLVWAVTPGSDSPWTQVIGVGSAAARGRRPGARGRPARSRRGGTG